MNQRKHEIAARTKLLERRAAIADSRASKDTDAVALSLEKRPEELAENEEISNVLVKLADRETTELKEIDAALKRLDQGTWGQCEKCHGVIPTNRMTALPQARTCATCAPDGHAQGIRML